MLRAALRSPTAGNARGTAWVVLEGPAQTSLYFDATTDEAWRSEHPQWHAGLSRAPVVLLAYASSGAMSPATARPTRQGPGSARARKLAGPLLDGDAAFGVMAALLAAVDAGLGSCILGAFRGEAELARATSGVPDGWRLFCAVVLGHPDGNDRRSPSLDRPLPPRSTRLHRGHW